MAAPSGAAAPNAAPPAAPSDWGYTQTARDGQTTSYVTQLKQRFAVGEHKLSTAERTARHASVVRALFAGCPGA